MGLFIISGNRKECDPIELIECYDDATCKCIAILLQTIRPAYLFSLLVMLTACFNYVTKQTYSLYTSACMFSRNYCICTCMSNV